MTAGRPVLAEIACSEVDLPAPRDPLTPRMHGLIGQLVAGRSLRDAARAVGISERTGRRWRERAGFADALREAIDAAYCDARAELRASMLEAVRVLRRIAADQQAPTASRVRSAAVLLERAEKLVRREEIEARLAKLEARDRGNGGSSTWEG